jgi:uncharacterized membrane protein YkvA (DUF1232 family)
MSPILAPTIGTARLVLRRWRDEDRDPFAAMNADPEVMRYFPRPLTRDESDSLVDRIEARFEADGIGQWAVERREDGRFLGFTGLAPATFEAWFTPTIEVGWRFERSAWGRGYATEAGRAALRSATSRRSCPGRRCSISHRSRSWSGSACTTTRPTTSTIHSSRRDIRCAVTCCTGSTGRAGSRSSRASERETARLLTPRDLEARRRMASEPKRRSKRSRGGAGIGRALSLLAFLPIASRVPMYTRLVTSLVMDDRMPVQRKALLAGAAGYLVLGRDLIPDDMPIIGGLDDLVVVILAVELFLDGVPDDLLNEKLSELGIDRAEFDRDVAQVRRLTPGPVRRTIRRVPELIGGVGDAMKGLGLGPRTRAWINKEERSA